MKLSPKVGYLMGFEKGKSGNPGGRKKMDPKVRDLAVENSEDALRTIIEIMKNKRAAPSTRLSAANAILDRGFGKPTNAVELSGPGGESLRPPNYLEGLTGPERLIAAARVIGNMLEDGRRAIEGERGANGELSLIDSPVIDGELTGEEKL